MTSTTTDRRALGDWAAEMMGLRCRYMNHPYCDSHGHVWVVDQKPKPKWPITYTCESLVSWAGMGLLWEVMEEMGYLWEVTSQMANIVDTTGKNLVMVIHDGDVPLAAFQAAREALGGAK